MAVHQTQTMRSIKGNIMTELFETLGKMALTKLAENPEFALELAEDTVELAGDIACDTIDLVADITCDTIGLAGDCICGVLDGITSLFD